MSPEANPEAEKKKLILQIMCAVWITSLVIAAINALLFYWTGFWPFILPLACFLFFGVCCLWATINIWRSP